MLGLILFILDNGFVSQPAWGNITHTRIITFYMELKDGCFDHAYQRLLTAATTVENIADRSLSLPSGDPILIWLKGGELRLVVCWKLAEQWKLNGSPEESILSILYYTTLQLSPKQLVYVRDSGIMLQTAQQSLLSAMQH
jgi:hypothetical protein